MVQFQAQRTGRSVAAVIREAIDDRFADRGHHERGRAAARLLQRHLEPGAGDEPEWDEIKADLEDDPAALPFHRPLTVRA